MRKEDAGVDTEREKLIGQHIGYRYDVNLAARLLPADPLPEELYRVHGLGRPQLAGGRAHGLRGGRPAIFDRNINGWVRIPKSMKLPDNQQDRDMLARELLVRFQTSPNHPLNELNAVYRKF